MPGMFERCCKTAASCVSVSVCAVGSSLTATTSSVFTFFALKMSPKAPEPMRLINLYRSLIMDGWMYELKQRNRAKKEEGRRRKKTVLFCSEIFLTFIFSI